MREPNPEKLNSLVGKLVGDLGRANPLRRMSWLVREKVRTHFFRGDNRYIPGSRHNPKILL